MMQQKTKINTVAPVKDAVASSQAVWPVLNVSVLVGVFRQRWRYLLIGGSIGVVIAIIAHVLIPRSFRAEYTAMPRSKDSSQAIAVGQFSDLPIMAVMNNDDKDRDISKEIMAILDSQRVQMQVISDLSRRPRGHSATISLSNLRKSFSVRFDPIRNRIQWSFTHGNRSVAAFVPNRAGELLDLTYNAMRQEQIEEQLVVLERRLREARIELAESERRVESFQAEHHVFDHRHQSRVSLEAVTQLHSRLSDDEVMLDGLLRTTGKDHPQVRQLTERIQAWRTRIEQFSGASGVGTMMSGTSAIVSASQLTMLRRESDALERQQRQREAVMKMIIAQIESLSLDKAKNHRAIMTIDRAMVPDDAIGPGVRTLAAIGLIVGIAATYLLFVIAMMWRSVTHG